MQDTEATMITSLWSKIALIMCREPGRHSTLDKRHEEGGSAYANAGSSLRSPPGCSRAFPPQKNRSLPTVLLCALTSDFTGGCPDRKSTRLNSSHQKISYAVFCLKKKKTKRGT